MVSTLLLYVVNFTKFFRRWPNCQRALAVVVEASVDMRLACKCPRDDGNHWQKYTVDFQGTFNVKCILVGVA